MEALAIFGFLGFIFGGAALGIAGKAKSKAANLEERIEKLEAAVRRPSVPQEQ